MGNAPSSYHLMWFTPDNKIPGRTNACIDFLTTKLQYSNHDLKMIYSVFRKLDINSTNTISIDSLLQYFCLECTPCNYRIFSFLKRDMRSQDNLTFIEFAVAIWNVLTLQADEIKTFLFSIFDIDTEFYNDANALLVIINLLHFCDDDLSKRLEYLSHLYELIESGEKIEDICIRLISCNDNANSLNMLRGLLVSSVWTLQVRLRNKLLGQDRWDRFCDIRQCLPECYNSCDFVDFMRESVNHVLHQSTNVVLLKRTRTVSGTLAYSPSDRDLFNNVVKDIQK
jgi:Ca2+-binding EF-hand superfamily protein